MRDNWYNLQKNVQGWDEIKADYEIINLVNDNKWSVDTSLAHNNIKDKVKTSNKTADFFILTDIEYSKCPLPMLIEIIKHKYEQCRVGGYLALLSYYLNSTKPNKTLPESYKDSIDIFFKKEFSFANKIQQKSTVIDNPIEVKNNNNVLVEGNNFLFVHPNIRYFLWK